MSRSHYCTITVSSDQPSHLGPASPAGSWDVLTGQNVIIWADAFWEDIVINGVSYGGSESQIYAMYTIQNVQENKTVYVRFAEEPEEPHIVFYVNTEHGTVVGRRLAVGGALIGSWNIVLDGVTQNPLTGSDWYAYYPVPNPGYEVWTSFHDTYAMTSVINGVQWGVDGWPPDTMLIKMDQIDRVRHHASFYFSRILRYLTFTQTSGGSIQVVGGQLITPRSDPWSIYLTYGVATRLIVTPNPGYEVSQVKKDGRILPIATEYSITGDNNNHTFDVTYARASKIITASVVGSGTITPSGAVSVFVGNNQKFIMIPDQGYSIDSVIVDGVSGEALLPNYSEYQFSNVQANHTIVANFGLSPYDITVTHSAHGRVDPSGEYRAYYGETKEFVIYPDDEYYPAKIIVDGVVRSLPQSGRLFIT